KGNQIWEYRALCRPVVLDRLKRVICHFDDDSRPKVAFDLLDWSGNRLQSFPIDHEILILRVSPDERSILLGLAGGELIHLSENFKLIWKGKIPGEIVDAALAGGKDQEILALYFVFGDPTVMKQGRHKLLSLTKDGRPLGEIQLKHHVDRIKKKKKGDAAYVYGNGPLGQFLAFYPGIFQDKNVKRTWFYRDQHHADYSSPLKVSLDQVMVGFEDIYVSPKKSRHSHLFSFDQKGAVRWYLPLQTEDGAYLYDQGLVSQNRFVAVATDLGFLSGYEVTPKQASNED
ncbi:MAG: hypothetical protein KDD33_13955, partial [Bdellovibrionales bacterium]|nr:hypothetical protein [Bdellovibrionales bacterium]